MKPFYVLSVCFMLSSIILINRDLYRHPKNNSVRFEFPVKIENLRYSTGSSAENMNLITAEFDIKSGVESQGEIEIIVDGKQKVNNRLMVKNGFSHYKVDFLLKNPENAEDQHLYSAIASLRIKGTPADMKQQAFGINKTTLAGNSRLAGK